MGIKCVMCLNFKAIVTVALNFSAAQNGYCTTSARWMFSRKKPPRNCAMAMGHVPLRFGLKEALTKQLAWVTKKTGGNVFFETGETTYDIKRVAATQVSTSRV